MHIVSTEIVIKRSCDALYIYQRNKKLLAATPFGSAKSMAFGAGNLCI